MVSLTYVVRKQIFIARRKKKK